jgi:predicted phage terminase large subunit-like protein
MRNRRDVTRTLLERRAIRSSFTNWCRYNGFEPAPHHQLIISKLEAAARGEVQRLALFVPPGAGKSTYSSILFPPWLLAQSARMVLAASHTTELAHKWGRKVRDLVRMHSATLGIKLADESQAAGRWAIDNGSEYYAAGAGTGIAGFRADCVIIDDPIRGREDADSETVREKIWDWYKSDLSPRLRPGGIIILIQTRWHEDDLAGRLLAEDAARGSGWEVVLLPARAEDGDQLHRRPGELLWDDSYGYGDFLRQQEIEQPPRYWSAQFQQRPTPETGDYFKLDWLRTYIKHPPLEHLSIYGASDYAVTADGGDYTVHLVVGVDPDNRMYLLDLWRKQASSDVWVEVWCDLVKKYKPQFWAEENIQMTSGIGPFLDMQARKHGAYTAREPFPTRGDKAVRAQSIRGRMALDGLYVPDHASWMADFRAELLTFPAGKHDDIVDALGLIGQLLDKVHPGRIVKPERRVPVDGYRDAQEDTLRDSFMTI